MEKVTLVEDRGVLVFGLQNNLKIFLLLLFDFLSESVKKLQTSIANKEQERELKFIKNVDNKVCLFFCNLNYVNSSHLQE